MGKDDGLRERKKRATREEISEVATRLFAERGFDAVTVTDVAAAANVSKMTVFNYFARKEDLFFDREDEARAIIGNALSSRPRGASPVVALGSLAHDLAAKRHPFAKFTAGTSRFWRTVEESNALLARARELRDAIEGDLAALLAESVGRKRGDPESILTSALLVSAWKVGYVEALRRQRAGDPSDSLRAVFLELLDRGVTAVRAGMKRTPYV